MIFTFNLKKTHYSDLRYDYDGTNTIMIDGDFL